MKRAALLIGMLPTLVTAQPGDESYWSYACDAYLYVFDTVGGEYRIYSRVEGEDALLGKYVAYLLTEGELIHRRGSVYGLVSDDIDDDSTEADFGDPELVTLESERYGYVSLTRCADDLAQRFIRDAQSYFEKCPKDVVQKCP